jgi:hypothetical protein
MTRLHMRCGHVNTLTMSVIDRANRGQDGKMLDAREGHTEPVARQRTEATKGTKEPSARLAGVSAAWKSQSYDGAGALFWYLCSLTVGGACFFFLLYAFSKPTVNVNPGLAAYRAPPGTILLPPPRQTDAPELADLPKEPPDPPNALARAEPSESQPQPEARPPVRKRPVVTRERDPRRYGYGWDFGYRGWRNNSRAWNGGGLRPWF